jgi:hypothetical protein
MIVSAAMRHSLQLVLEFIRKPEWVAAIALLIQAAILWLQARILRKHGETMEEHAGIAKAQATTAELIGKALNQHEKILADQTKIMDEQFTFQRRVEAQAARLKVYEALLDVNSNIELLIQVGSQNPANVDSEKRVFSSLVLSVAPCQKAVVTTIHLTPTERTYFLRFLTDVSALALKQSPRPEVTKFWELKNKYTDFLTMLSNVSQTP